jgi:hypothetical protein
MNDRNENIIKLSERATQFSVKVPDNAWGKIQKKLSSKKRKNLRTFGAELQSVILIFLIALVTVIVIVYQIDKRKQQPQVEGPKNQSMPKFGKDAG